MTYYRRPSGDFIRGTHQRCTVCGFWLRPDRTPKGGRFTAKVQTQKTNSYDTSPTITASDNGGCPDCQSFFWDGGKPGDLLRSW